MPVQENERKSVKKIVQTLNKNTMLFGFVFFLIVVNFVRSRSVYVVFFEKTDFHILELKLKLL